ncbi:MAG: efflux RND transporter periplasmic adaptor subunit [Planctomycetes bacterium]|nr:efflux RND transporter periplasmic adaptor subunit [Planctomycetota bacterium]
MFRFHRQQTAGICWAVLAALPIAACNPSSQPVEAAQVDAQPEPIAITLFSEQLGLYLEYPQLVVGSKARFLIHLTVLASGDPIRSGQARLELTDASGATKTLRAAQPKRDGLFIPTATFADANEYRVRLVLESPQGWETMDLPNFVVHPDVNAAHAAADAAATEEPADLIHFLLEQQWKINLLCEPVQRRTLTQRLQVPGEVEAINHAIAVVSSPLGGRLLAAESGHLPHIGDKVEKGQILGYLEPPLTTSDAAALQANQAAREAMGLELSLREFDLQNMALEVEQQRLQAQGQLKFARQTLARVEPLQNKGLVTAADLQAAQQAVEVAEQQLETAQTMKASYAVARQQLADIGLRNAAQTADPMNMSTLRVPLVAAISGEVVNVNHVEGEVVQAQDEIYRLLNLEHVWIAAHVSEFDLAAISAKPGAVLRFPAYPARSFDILGEMGGELVAVGREVDQKTRTVELHYQAPNPEGLFRAGMFADVFLETQKSIDAVAIPESAVVMDNGQTVAYVQHSGEAFQRRELELGIQDGVFIEVLSGLKAGERIAVNGGYLIKLASAGSASFGDGHVH